MHWIPGDPFSTHVLNVLHLLLPAGEEWFVETFKEALPLIEDEQLRDDVVGFIGQEAMHANAHTGVLVASEGERSRPDAVHRADGMDLLQDPRTATADRSAGRRTT